MGEVWATPVDACALLLYNIDSVIQIKIKNNQKQMAKKKMVGKNRLALLIVGGFFGIYAHCCRRCWQL